MFAVFGMHYTFAGQKGRCHQCTSSPNHQDWNCSQNQQCSGNQGYSSLPLMATSEASAVEFKKCDLLKYLKKTLISGVYGRPFLANENLLVNKWKRRSPIQNNLNGINERAAFTITSLYKSANQRSRRLWSVFVVKSQVNGKDIVVLVTVRQWMLSMCLSGRNVLSHAHALLDFKLRVARFSYMGRTLPLLMNYFWLRERHLSLIINRQWYVQNGLP